MIEIPEGYEELPDDNKMDQWITGGMFLLHGCWAHSRNMGLLGCYAARENRIIIKKVPPLIETEKPQLEHYVYGPSFGAPKFRHPNETAARIEAERLAKANPGNTFEVLAIVAKCSIERPELKWSDNWEQEAPF